MNEELILERVKVGCHGEISGKVQTDDSAYDELLGEMQEHFANDQVVSVISYIPSVGELCAGVLNRHWYRVKVVNKLSGGRTGCIVTCFFVDEGLETTIPISGLKHLPPKFSELPFLVKNIHLDGIQPYSMKVSPEDLSIYHGPKKIWDEAAVKYIEDNVNVATQVRCTVMETYANGTLSVRMFLRSRSGGLYCLNELLVNKQYAAWTDRPEETESVRAQSSESLAADIQKVFRKRHTANLTLKQNIKDVAVKSDTEYYSRTAIPSEKGDSCERGYVTDNQGISAISHRRFQRKPVTTSEEIKQPDQLKTYGSAKSLSGLNGYSTSHMDLVGRYGDADAPTIAPKQERGVSEDRSPVSDAVNNAKFETENTSPCQRMRGVRGSHSSYDENVKKQIDTRRQIILNQFYGEDLREESTLYDDLGARPKITSPPKNDSSLSSFMGHGSSSYGRGSSFTPDLINRKESKSPTSASICSDSSSVKMLPMGRGAMLFNQISSHSKSQVGRRSPYEGRETSDSESFFGDKSVTDSIYAGLRSVSDLESCAESEFSVLSRNERRHQARVRGVKSDVDSDTYQGVVMKNKLQVPSKADKTFSQTSAVSLNSRKRISSMESTQERVPHDNSSGNESATSEISIVAASVKGQAQFKAARLPKSAMKAGQSKRSYVDERLKNERIQAAASSGADGISVISEPVGSGASSDERFVHRSPSLKEQLQTLTLSPSQEIEQQKQILDAAFIRDTKQQQTYRQEVAPAGLGIQVRKQEVSPVGIEKRMVPQEVAPPKIDKQQGLRQEVAPVGNEKHPMQEYPKPSMLKMALSDASSGNEQVSTLSKQVLKGKSVTSRSEGAMAAERYENGSAHSVTMTDAKSKIICEMEGKRMLSDLVQRSSRGGAKTQATGFSALCYEVLVHGSRPPKPVYKMDNARFTDHIALAYTARRYPDLTLAQAYSWPAITRGQHVITVSPPGGGKTLAYLCPLISALGDAKVYHQVNRNGRGPFVIVLSFTWKRARFVYSEALSLIGGAGDTRVILVHGGAQMEEQKAVELLNGCEILVATPPSLSRILEAGYTDLRRLCHLVVDDADQTLSSFRNDIGNLIKSYDLVIKNEMKNLGCPRQILCFGAQWNAAISGFMQSNLIEPVLIITSPFEAAIYGQVRQVTHMCRKADRLKGVLGILENLPDDSCHPVIIFATEKRDILMLYKTLNTSSRFCLMVHEGMDTFEVDRIAEQWPVPLLVCWDEHTAKLKITNATAVIHYDMPPSKTKFSNRLCCMRQYFNDFSKTEQSTIRPTSHMIITEDCTLQLKSLNDLLVRLDCERPAELKSFITGMLEEREEDKRRELCTQTLAFGTCRETTRCRFRHRIITDVDCIVESDWLPNEGEVKVKVTHIQDASHYYVRMLGLKREGMTSYDDLSLRYAQMQLDLAIWYSNLHNKKRYAPDITEASGYEIGEVCGYEDNEVFHRVQIFDVKKSLENEAVPVIQALVKFVDSGRMKEIPAYKLYVLPRHLRDLPFQAVEVFVCKVRPVDKDTAWTQKANMYIHEALIGKELVGNVLLRIGYILWLDPLLHRKYLPTSNTVSHQFYVQEELLRNKFADENKNHLQKLYKLCEGKMNIPKALLKKSEMTPTLDTDVLPATRERHEIHVSSVRTPDLFYVQRSEKLEDLLTLMEEINAFVEKNDIFVDIEKELKQGKHCLAQYTNFDDRWYRARILEVTENHVEVFFVDYGDKDSIPKKKVREIPPDKFHDLPQQAIECKLCGISPIGEEWDENTTGDVLWDLTHYVNDDMRAMTATVRGKERAQYGGRHKFIVDLSFRSRSCGLDIAEELSRRQLAVPAEDSEIQPLFSRPSRLKMKLYRSPVEKIPDMCSSLYWEQDEGRSVKLSEEMYGIISTSLNRCDVAIVTQCVSCLVRLIGRVQWDRVHDAILKCILCLVHVGEMCCDELIDGNCVPLVIRCLEMNSNTVCQQQAADFIAQIASISSKLKTFFQLNDNIQVLFELICSTDVDVVQGAVCRAFASLCTGSERVYAYLMDKSICQKLTKCLLNTAEHDVAEGILILISALAQHDSVHEDLKKESLIEAIVKSLSKSNCNKCIQYSVQQCDYFSSTRRKHKTFLLEQQMVPILTRILQLDLPSATKQLCRDLLTSLVIKVPSEPITGTAIRTDRHGRTVASESVPPEVKWSQNTFRVVLKATVTGVRGSPQEIVKFTDHSVKFRVSVDGLLYAFNYKLFDSIIIEKSTVEVGTNIVAISMKKAKEGKWSRLLHDKVKPTNLSVDFENWVDSSSDSEVCDDDQPFVLKKKQRGSKGFRTGLAQERSQYEVRENESDTSDSLENEEDRDNMLYEDFLS